MIAPGLRVDVHQHLWTEPLLEALTARRSLPYVRRRDGVSTLHSAGEHPYPIEPASASPGARAALVADDGLDLALVAISSPIGIEALPRAEAAPLIAAHLEGVEALPDAFGAWGPVPLADPDPSDVDDVLARGCAGVSLPAGALGHPSRLDAVGSLLERLDQRGAPLFVHPGPAPGRLAPASADPASTEGPPWWPALTDYVAQMQAAWLCWVTAGRRAHPGLKVVFTLLAGGAPLLAERLAARGGPPVSLRDPLTFYETSGFGPFAVETIGRRVGEEQLLLGSDRPLSAPLRDGGEALALNAARILPPQEATA